MNLQQAKKLLGINQDDEREIKRKYHNQRKQRQQNQVTHGKFPICLRVWPIPISAAVSI